MFASKSAILALVALLATSAYAVPADTAARNQATAAIVAPSQATAARRQITAASQAGTAARRQVTAARSQATAARRQITAASQAGTAARVQGTAARRQVTAARSQAIAAPTQAVAVPSQALVEDVSDDIDARRAPATVTLCSGSLSPANGCLTISVVSDSCVNLTGGLSFLNKEISNARVPGGFVCTFYEYAFIFDYLSIVFRIWKLV